MLSVKGSTSWLVYNSCLTVIFGTSKCKDDMYLQTAVSSGQLDFPLKTAIQAVFKTSKQQIIRIKIIICCFKV